MVEAVRRCSFRHLPSIGVVSFLEAVYDGSFGLGSQLIHFDGEINLGKYG